MKDLDTPKQPKLKLYTVKAEILGEPKIIQFDLDEAIKKAPTSSVYGFSGSPGVIVKNFHGGHNIYGLKSRNLELGDLDKEFFYGNLKNPKNILHLMERYAESKEIVNGCIIDINRENRGNTWTIWISPDYDLRKMYPPTFDESLVKSLEISVLNYLKELKTKERIGYAIMHKTAKMNGIPFHQGFYFE